MNKENYIKIMSWWQSHKKLLKVTAMAERILEIVTVVGYLVLLLYSAYVNGGLLLRSAVTSVIALYGCTLLRFTVNAPRPYQKYDTLPAINKYTKGQSFPSRHLTSISVISISMMYMNTYVGIIFILFTFMMGVLRVLLGVHFVKDVAVGAAIGWIIGITGIYLIPLLF